METKISLQACGKLLGLVTAYNANTDSRCVAISRLPRCSEGAEFSGLGEDSRNSEQELNLSCDSTGCCESLRGLRSTLSAKYLIKQRFRNCNRKEAKQLSDARTKMVPLPASLSIVLTSTREKKFFCVFCYRAFQPQSCIHPIAASIKPS